MANPECLNRLRRLPLEVLQKFIDEADCLPDLWKSLGLVGFSTSVYKEIFKERGLDLTPVQKRGQASRKGQIQFRDASGRIVPGGTTAKMRLFLLENESLIFSENSCWDGAKVRRLIRTYNHEFKWLEEKCQLCPVEKEWNGKPLVLQLDHIDGRDHNNSLKNLRFLCPNCHSQCDTWGGRNIGKKGREFYKLRDEDKQGRLLGEAELNGVRGRPRCS